MVYRRRTRLIGITGLLALGVAIVPVGMDAIAQGPTLKPAEPPPLTTPLSEKIPTMAALEEALGQRDWRRADGLTWRILHGGMENPDGRRFRQFPCDRLQQVDRAWRRASGDRFGFSVQRDLWASLMNRLGDRHRTRDEFDRAVGWRSESETTSETDQAIAPVGRWPEERLWLSGNVLRFGCGDVDCTFARTVVDETRPALEYIFPRLSQCRLVGNSGSSPL